MSMKLNHKISIKVVLLAISSLASGLIGSAHAQDYRWDPYYGTNGGWRSSDGGGMRYDPYYGTNGGWRNSNGGGYRWDPYYGTNGGWRQDPNRQ